MPGYVFKDGGPIPDSELQEHAEAAQLDAITTTTTRTSISSTAFDTPTSSTSLSTSNYNFNNNNSNNAPPPTESHALANAEHEVRGASQQDYSEGDGDGDGEVRNLGWFEHPNDIAQLVGGLPNEELWTLVRRFNKQMYHVKATAEQPPGGLDLYIADEDEFSPDKLRSNVERLYMTVIIGLLGMGKHVARLRSWREPRRTGAFLAVSDH